MPKRYKQICANIAVSSLTKQTLVPADKSAYHLFWLFNHSNQSKNYLVHTHAHIRENYEKMIKLRMFITTDVYLKHMQNQLMRFMKSSALS